MAKSKLSVIKKIVSVIIIFTYIPVSTLCGLDFARAEEGSEVVSGQSDIQATSNSDSSANSDVDKADTNGAISPEQAAQMRASAATGGDTRIPIAFNSLQAFQADPFTGAATFNLPVVVPPGRNGIQPNISLSYSSSSGNGICGKGWNLELGAIERSTKKGVPSYTNNDTFIFISGGATTELVNIGSGRYRSKIESAFMDFYFDGSSWLVRDKAGNKYYFGQDSSSRIEGAPGIFRWAIDKVADIHSNYMKISYMKDSNQLYPQLVEYAGFNNDENFVNGRVEFGYAVRNDKILNYRPKFPIKTNLKLAEIVVKTGDNIRVRKYLFTYNYSPSTGQSLVSGISQYPDNDQEILPPLTFSYQQTSAGWTHNTGWTLPASGIADQGMRIVDVNNDGFADILRYKQSEEYTFLNNQQNGWQQTTNWQLPDLASPNWPMTFYGIWGDEGVRLVDVNGDGWLDLAQQFLDARTYEGFDQNFVFTNNKSTGWSYYSRGTIPTYITYIHAGYTEFRGTVFSDVNGDGLADIVRARNDWRATWLNNNGSGWPTETLSWALPDGDLANGTDLVDVNADGLVDMVYADGSTRWIRLNNGQGWNSTGEWGLPAGNLIDGSTQFIDVNADGLVDLLIAKAGTRETYINNTQGWTRNSSWDLPDGDFSNFGVRLADVNADGLIDIYKYTSSEEPRLYTNNGPAPDLLLSINNGIGGTVSLSYQPSTKFDNHDPVGLCQLPFPVYVVTNVTTSDGRGNAYNTAYSYAQGRYDALNREFRGFGKVEAIDSEGNVSETYFFQDDIFKGKPWKSMVRDSSRNIHSKSKTEWAYKELYDGKAKFPYVTLAENFTFNGNTSDENGYAKKTFTTNDYVFLNNLLIQTATVEHGDITVGDIPDDDRKTVANFSNNETDWLIGFQNNIAAFDGNENKVSEKWFYYDNAANYTTAPTKGKLTKDEVWLHNPLTGQAKTISSSYSYNTYGQLMSTTDALNHTTSTIYESALHTYPEVVTNAINHTLHATTDPKTGQVLTSADPNGQVSSNVYDEFGRLTQVIGPKDSALYPGVIYEYDLTQTPIKVTKRTKADYNAIPTYITTYSFFDGLGRLIETKSPAENNPQTGVTRQIISGIVKYNSRGQVEEKYLPYFVDNESSNFVTPEYNSPKFAYLFDALGRVSQATNPDLTYSTVSYNDWTVTKTDENGHSKKEYYDVYGRLIRVDEQNSTQTYSTNYTYDIAGNLTKVIDNQNNITQITYDSLGRKIAMNDPDMGSWNYVYDEAGNLTSQTDAKNQSITFNYDAINRLSSKTIGVKTVQYTYDESVVQYSTGRLTQVDDPKSVTKFRYDNLGRETQSIKVVSSQSFQVTRNYDALDRLTSVTYPDNDTVIYEYNKAGLVKKIYSRIGNTGSKIYVNKVNYNVNGQIIHIEYGNGTYTDYNYNPNTLRLAHFVTYGPGGAMLQSFDYQFDSVGNVTNITDSANNASQSFVYDDLDRLMQATGNAYGTINYTYDSIGNMTQKGNLTLIYGENGAPPHAVTSLIGPSGTTNISYDQNGNMISKGNKTFSYDTENRLISVGVPATGNQTVTINLSQGWNFFSLPVIPADLSVTSVLAPIAGKYEQAARTSGIEDLAYVDSLKFEHFVNDAQFNDFTQFEYGRGYQIYITDPAGCSLTLNGEIAANPPEYDLNQKWNLIGSPTVSTRDINDSLNNLVYNVDYDYLARYNKDTASFQRFYNNPATNEFSQFSSGEAYYLYSTSQKNWQIIPWNSYTTFEYDGDGGRVRKEVTTSQGHQVTTYVGSLFEKETRIAADGTQITADTKHIFMGSQRVASVKSVNGGAKTTAFYHSDHLGSSNVLTNDSGNRLALYEYSPYGELVTGSAPQATSYLFTGKELDDSTGLYFYGARYYDAELGRFITPDSIVQAPGDPQSLNRYSYCRNNPLNYIDPTGHSWKSFWKKVGDFFSNVGKAIAGNPGVFIAGLAVGIFTGWAISGMISGLSDAMAISGTGTTFWEGFVLGGMEIGIPTFTGTLASGLASGQKFVDSLRGAAVAGVAAFLLAGTIEGAYAEGWQKSLHFEDVRADSVKAQMKKYNLLESQGRFQEAMDVKTSLMKNYDFYAHAKSNIVGRGIQHIDTVASKTTGEFAGVKFDWIGKEGKLNWGKMLTSESMKGQFTAIDRATFVSANYNSLIFQSASPQVVDKAISVIPTLYGRETNYVLYGIGTYNCYNGAAEVDRQIRK